MAPTKKPAAKSAKTASPKAEDKKVAQASTPSKKKVKAVTQSDKAAKAERAARAAATKSTERLAGDAKTPRLQIAYSKEIAPALKAKFGYKNDMQIPRLTKIVINMGVGEAVADQKQVTQAAEEMMLIAGQKPVITKSKKAEASFKLREGLQIGCRVTLRKQRMYEFLDRFVTIAMPRIRDFRGINPKSFDGRGNYNMGLKEQIIFPEINYDRISSVRGMDITIVTTAKTDEEARALLEGFNMPFRK